MAGLAGTSPWWSVGRAPEPPGRRRTAAFLPEPSRNCAIGFWELRRRRGCEWCSRRRAGRSGRECGSGSIPISASTSSARTGSSSACAPASDGTTEMGGTRTWISSASKWRSTVSVGSGIQARTCTPRIPACGTPTARAGRHFVPYALEPGIGVLAPRPLPPRPGRPGARRRRRCGRRRGGPPAGGNADRPRDHGRRRGDRCRDPHPAETCEGPGRVRCRPGHAERYVFRGAALPANVPFSPGYGLRDPEPGPGP